MNVRQYTIISLALGLLVSNQVMVAEAAVITPGAGTSDNLTDATNTWDINAAAGASDADVNFIGSNDELTITDSVAGSGTAELNGILFAGSGDNTLTIGDGINDVFLIVDSTVDVSSGSAINLDADNVADTGNATLQIDFMSNRADFEVTLDDGTTTSSTLATKPGEATDISRGNFNGASAGEGTIISRTNSSTVIDAFNGVSIGATRAVKLIQIGQDGEDSAARFVGAFLTTTLDATEGISLGTSGSLSNDTYHLQFDNDANGVLIDADIFGANSGDANTLSVRADGGAAITFNGNITSNIDTISNDENGGGLTDIDSGSIIFNGTVAADSIDFTGEGDGDADIDFNNTVTASTINFTGGAVAAEDLNINFSGNVTGNFTLDEGSAGSDAIDLAFDGSTTQTLTGSINAEAAGESNVVVNNDLIVTGNVGATRLGTLALQAGDTLTIGSSGSTTSLGATTGTINGDFTVEDTVQLVAGTTINFANGSTLSVSDASVIEEAMAVIDADTNSASVVIGSSSSDTLTIDGDLSSAKNERLVLIDANDGGTLTVNSTIVSDFGDTGYPLSDYTVSTDSNQLVVDATLKSGQGIADTLNVTLQEGTSLRNAVLASANDSELETAIDAAVLGTTSQQQELAEQSVGSASSTGATVEAAASTASQVFDTVSTHLSAQRGGSRLASGSTGVSTGNNVFGNKVWSKAFGNVAYQDDSPGVTGFDSHTFGMAFGTDVVETDKGTFGVALSYAHTNIDTTGTTRNETDMNSFQLSLYGDYNTDNYYVEGYTAWAVNDIATERHIKIGSLNRTAKGDYWSHQFTTKIEGGRYYSLPHNLTLTPTVGLLYSHVFNNPYSETGAGSLNLDVTPDDADVLDFSFGAKLNATYQKASGATLTPELRLSASYDLAADEATATQRYQGGGSTFTVEGAEVEPLALHLGTSLDYAADRVTLSVGYDGEYREDFHSHTGYVQMQYMLQQPNN